MLVESVRGEVSYACRELQHKIHAAVRGLINSVETEPGLQQKGEAPLPVLGWFYSGCLRRLATIKKRKAAAMMAHTSRMVELSIMFLL